MRLNVRPKITLHIKPRETRNNKTITWEGSVKGGPYPAAGIPMLVEVKEGK